MIKISKDQAKKLWIHAQGLDEKTPFGKGARATQAAVEHLGYVQIDTINVVERCHHHILFTRIPDYKRQHLHQSQSKDKTVFEYWTHALSYVPTKDFRFFMPEMKRVRLSPSQWFQSVKKEEMQKVLRLIKKDGPLSIRDIEDDVLVEKNHPWASRKPSKKALQLGFYTGRLVISERQGMLKKYELLERHFDWDEKPKAATGKEIIEYLVTRSLRSQSLVSLESICYLDAKKKMEVKKLLESKVRKEELVPVKVDGIEKMDLWIRPEDLELKLEEENDLVHILSPFDPLVIQRKRLQAFFDYEHRFEAYLPKEKRLYGYFALPVLLNGKIVAALDLKTDRDKKKLLLQKWNWVGKAKSTNHKKLIEEELHRFEKFQLDF
ncbi:winged helix-turn-helix domain-containing protein [Bdellovibrio sp. HCB-110]|uniref:winged helix-turn-helix domain-containing protein n=1 Tax=Bdellovibrio sp. HCB-110 TaxID=3391182 RepID=UPI0039B4A6AE